LRSLSDSFDGLVAFAGIAAVILFFDFNFGSNVNELLEDLVRVFMRSRDREGAVR